MKAMLEMNLPTCCATCKLLKIEGKIAICIGNQKAIGTQINGHSIMEERAPYCPLKIIEEGAEC